IVLSDVAEIIRARLRQYDVACRYGGEELVIVMPEAPKDVVVRRAEELAQSISRHEVSYKGKPLTGITISAGVSWHPDDGDSMNSLIKAADSALYRAKESGRNRVVVAGADPVPARGA
ncbi:MAG: GGDEF domain-containing protein, partial [Gammaproteobacteria bacterium]